MKKILLILLLIPTFVFPQWDGTTNKTIHEKDLFGSIFDQALDSAGISSDGASVNLDTVYALIDAKVDTNYISTDIESNELTLKVPYPLPILEDFFDSDISGWGQFFGGVSPTLEWLNTGGGFTGVLHCVTDWFSGTQYDLPDLEPGSYTFKATYNVITLLPATDLGFHIQCQGQGGGFYIEVATGVHSFEVPLTVSGGANATMFIYSDAPAEFYIDKISLRFAGTESDDEVILKNNVLDINVDTVNVEGVLNVGGEELDVAEINETSAGIDRWTDGLSATSNILKVGLPGRQFYYNNGAYSDFWVGGFVTVPYNLPYNGDMLAYEYRTDYYNDTLKPFINTHHLTYLGGTGTPIWHPTAGARFAGIVSSAAVGNLPDSVGLDWNWADWVTGVQTTIGDEVNKTPVVSRFPMPVYGFRFRFAGTISHYYRYPKMYAYFSDFTSYGGQSHVEQGWHFYGKGNFPVYFGGNIELPIGNMIIKSGTINISQDELERIDGLTSSAQTQINTKAPTASPVFSGTPKLGSDTLATKAYVRAMMGGEPSAGSGVWGFITGALADQTDLVTVLDSLGSMFFTGSDSIHYGADTVIVNHSLGFIPTYIDIQLISSSFGYPVWLDNSATTSTTFLLRRGNVGLETINNSIKFKWMAKK